MNILIKNAKIITPEKIIEDQNLVIENRIIKEISENFDKTKKYKIIDAEGDYISPGFFDTHIHGAGNGVFETADKDLFTEISNLILENGITTFLPTLLCNETHIKNVVKQINGHPEIREHIAGIYIEGPFINPEKKGGINPDYIRKPDLDYLKKIIDISEGHLKMMTIAPELEGIDKIIDHLSQNDIIPTFGHSMTDLNTALSKKGVRNITHLFNAMSGISHRSPGLAALPFIDKEIFVEVNGDGVHIDNQIIKMCFEHLNPERIISITDAVISAGMPYGDYFYDTDKKVSSSERGVRYKKNDVLIGSSYMIPDVLRNLKNNTNASMNELINSVTINPAKMLSADKDRGSIETGKRADLVIFDNNFNIKEVITS
ncbi:MAG: N-acetylglucosamine-6-phosphate deacetylase [Flavobacteriia bacterium]|nr:MAG: N-acetylglucosamine-6-phosphate deacetylase [Flavobacteriia bacterium]